MLEAESVVVEPETEELADGQQHGDVEENSERVMLASAAVGPIAQRTRPVGREQQDQERQSDEEIGDFQPAMNAVVTLGFRRIGFRDHRGGVGHAMCVYIPALPSESIRRYSPRRQRRHGELKI